MAPPDTKDTASYIFTIKDATLHIHFEWVHIVFGEQFGIAVAIQYIFANLEGIIAKK